MKPLVIYHSNCADGFGAAFGGGGHKNAAGFEVPIETLLGWMK